MIKVNESVPCRDGNYVYELYGTGTVSVEVYVDGREVKIYGSKKKRFMEEELKE